MTQIMNEPFNIQSTSAEPGQQTNVTTAGSKLEQTNTINTLSLMKKYKYDKDHYYFLAGSSLLMPYYMFQRFTLFFLLTHTNSGCQFTHDFATLFLIITCGEILVIPLTGYVADNFKVYNHIILLTTFLIHFTLSFVIFALFLIFNDTNVLTTNSFKWIIFSIFIFQSYISMQFNNSLFKLMKLFMDYNANTKTEENKSNLQTMYFTSIGIWSQLYRNLLLLFPLFISFVMIQYIDTINFYIIEAVIIGLYIIFGSLVLVVAKSIYNTFTNTDIYHFRSSEIIDHLQAVQQQRQPGYIKRSFKSLFGNTITRNGVIHLLLVYVLTDLMQSYEPLAVAGIKVSGNQSLNNFCGGFLTNLIYQSMFGSVFTIIGALIYMYVIVPYVDSKQFYKLVYPILSVFVSISLFAISGIVNDMDETILAVSLGFMLAFFTYAHQYDDFMNLGYMNADNVGFYQILYSYSMTIWKIFGYLFLYLDVMNTMIAIVIWVLLIASVIQSLLFSRHFIKTKHNDGLIPL